MLNEALTRRLIKSLESLLSEVSKITDVLREQVESSKETKALQEAHRNSGPLVIKVAESVETHKSSADKKEDASYQRRILFWQKVTFIVLFVYALVSVFIWRSNKKAADAAKSAADTAHNALILNQRPWIKIKHRIVKPLRFNFVGAEGPAATMTVEDTLENVGKGVALDVLSWEDVLPMDPDMSSTSALKRRAEWCGANKEFNPKGRTTFRGNVLFPGERLIQESTMGLLMKSINKAARDNERKMGAWYRDGPLAGKGAFVMVGCVVYRASFEKGGTRPHATGFLYELGQPEPGGAMQPFVAPRGIADKLQLIQFPSGFYAY